MKVLLGDIEFGSLMVGDESREVAVVHRPYKMMTIDDEVAEDVAESLVAKGKYDEYVIPDMFEGDVVVMWRKEDGDGY